jgi:multidrug efflux pump subunit AcrA (membrane-fusion protein)
VLASVDESDIGKIKSGLDATITVDAFPELSFKGSVVRIATKGVNVSNVVTFEVKIEVLGKMKSLLKPEMTANIEIVADKDDDALLVPVEAVSRKKGQRFVTVRKPDGTDEERTVIVGISDGVNMAIVSGLDESDKIVIRGGEVDSRWRQMSESRRMMMMGRTMRRR